jgi:hypothetical protein
MVLQARSLTAAPRCLQPTRLLKGQPLAAAVQAPALQRP